MSIFKLFVYMYTIFNRVNANKGVDDLAFQKMFHFFYGSVYIL